MNLIERLKNTDEISGDAVVEVWQELERLEAERDAMQAAYGKADEICDGLLIENAALNEALNLTYVSDRAALTAESAALKETQAQQIERLKADVKRVTDFYGKTPMDSFRRIEALEAENAAFEPFLKEGETPFERFTRERMDGDALLKTYGKALTEIEALKADVAAMSANQKAYVDIHAAWLKAKAENADLKSDWDRFHHLMKSHDLHPHQ
jgi:hypothetical protein